MINKKSFKIPIAFELILYPSVILVCILILNFVSVKLNVAQRNKSCLYNALFFTNDNKKLVIMATPECSQYFLTKIKLPFLKSMRKCDTHAISEVLNNKTVFNKISYVELKNIMKNNNIKIPVGKTSNVYQFADIRQADDKILIFYKNLDIIDLKDKRQTELSFNYEYWPYTLSSDGKTVVWLKQKEDRNIAVVFDIESEKTVSEIPLPEYGGGVCSFAVNNDLKLLAAGYQRKMKQVPIVILFNIDSREELTTIKI